MMSCHSNNLNFLGGKMHILPPQSFFFWGGAAAPAAPHFLRPWHRAACCVVFSAHRNATQCSAAHRCEGTFTACGAETVDDDDAERRREDADRRGADVQPGRTARPSRDLPADPRLHQWPWTTTQAVGLHARIRPHWSGLYVSQFALIIHHYNVQQGVAVTRRNTTGPPCSRGAIIRLEAAWRHRLACAVEAACRPAVECYIPRQTTTTDTSDRY